MTAAAELVAAVAEYRAICEASEYTDVDVLWGLLDQAVAVLSDDHGAKLAVRAWDALRFPVASTRLDLFAALNQYQIDSGESIDAIARTLDPNDRAPRPKE